MSNLVDDRSSQASNRIDQPQLRDLHTSRDHLVAILLCTKNGERFLPQQLDSIAAQTHANWIVYASDDGSTDRTKDIISAFAERHPSKVILRDGPRQGCSKNFLSLATDVSLDGDFFAFCDQDDVWHSDRVTRALQWLAPLANKTPTLYGSRAEIIDQHGRPSQFSILFEKQPSFKNALVQNIMGGNTMVFNRATKRLLEQAGNLDIIAHDWWTYQITSAAGGTVLYDFRPSIQYRQHDSNIIGSNLGWSARLHRAKMLYKNRLRNWTDVNVAALEKCMHLIQPDNQNTLAQFKFARSQTSILRRLRLLRACGVYRQTRFSNLTLMLAAIAGKL